MLKLHELKLLLQQQNTTAVDAANLPEPLVVFTTLLNAYSFSSMPPTLIGDLTNQKEFEAIVEAISFIKAYSFPLTSKLVKEVALISDRTYRNRTKALIESMIKLQQYADDLYSEERGRKVYGDAGYECLIDENGTIIEDKVETKIVKILKEVDKEKSITALIDSTYIDSINVLTNSAIIETLLSEYFLSKITNGGFYIGKPLKFYLIEPMRYRPREMVGDPKWEKYSIRLINAIMFGAGSDKALMYNPLKMSFVNMVGSLVGYLLKSHKVESGHKLKKTGTIETLGRHLINVYIKSVSGGGHIHSRNTSLHYLNHKTTTNLMSKLFKKVSKWKAGEYSIAYETTPQMEEIVTEAFEAFMKLPVMEVDKDIEKGFTKNTNIEHFNKGALGDMHIKDRVFLMSRIVGFRDGKYYFAIDAIDRQASRVYSSITAIQAIAREAMGFKSYDMAAAQTSICLQLVQNPNKYPQHQEMIKNKRLFREKIANLTGWDYKKVKQELSALDNGLSINGYPAKVKKALMAFFEEGRVLMEDVLETVKINDSIIYAQAVMNAKDIMKDGEVIRKKLSSIYFFIWTQYERQIRNTMKSCFTQAVYDVHDAVYSREKIDCKILEKAVFRHTGFHVNIEK